jgi:hypothetical protein
MYIVILFISCTVSNCIAHNGQGLLLWRYSLNVQPRAAARFYSIVEDKISCLVLFVQPELLLMSAHSRSFVRRTAIAASPLLCAFVAST